MSTPRGIVGNRTVRVTRDRRRRSLVGLAETGASAAGGGYLIVLSEEDEAIRNLSPRHACTRFLSHVFYPQALTAPAWGAASGLALLPRRLFHQYGNGQVAGMDAHHGRELDRFQDLLSRRARL